MDKKDKTVILKVAEAKSYDIGKGIARIDPAVAHDLGLQTGDVIGIEGKKKTAALIWQGYPEDSNSGLIRIDGTVRLNGGVGIDDRVKVRKIQTAPAEKILFAPTQHLKIQGGEAYLAHNLEGRVISRGDVVELNIMGRRVDLVAVSTKPAIDSVIITAGTQIEISAEPAKQTPSIPRVSYEDIGGLWDKVIKLREMIELPLRHPELFKILGISPIKRILLYGPTGTGKTLLVRAFISEIDANTISVSYPEIMSKYYGESEKHLREIFDEAIKNAPSIIFIDDIDCISSREEISGEVERRMITQFFNLLDGLEATENVFFIAATNRPESLDTAFMRRMDRVIELSIPDVEARLEIFQIHTRGMRLSDDINLNELAKMTDGFVGADIKKIIFEAAMNAMCRVLPEIELEQKIIPKETLDKLIVTRSDFEEIMKNFKPQFLKNKNNKK